MLYLLPLLSVNDLLKFTVIYSAAALYWSVNLILTGVTGESVIDCFRLSSSRSARDPLFSTPYGRKRETLRRELFLITLLLSQVKLLFNSSNCRLLRTNSILSATLTWDNSHFRWHVGLQSSPFCQQGLALWQWHCATRCRRFPLGSGIAAPFLACWCCCCRAVSHDCFSLLFEF